MVEILNKKYWYKHPLNGGCNVDLNEIHFILEDTYVVP
jgi:hypothetical protein